MSSADDQGLSSSPGNYLSHDRTTGNNPVQAIGGNGHGHTKMRSRLGRLTASGTGLLVGCRREAYLITQYDRAYCMYRMGLGEGGGARGHEGYTPLGLMVP